MATVSSGDVGPLSYPYFLRKEVLGGYPALELTKTDFEEIRAAKEVLVAASSIEEKYNALLFNYTEFEKELAELTVDVFLDRPNDYEDFFWIRQRIGVRVVNILTTARMYMDHLAHDIKSCVKDSETASVKAKEILAEKYDGDKYYRLMEAVRNYTQHRSLPVGNVETKSDWTINGKVKDLCKHTIDVFVSVADLKRDRKFKRSVLVDFEGDVDLKKALRRYVGSVSDGHANIRAYIEPSIEQGRTTISDWRKRYREFSEEDPGIALLAIRVEGGRKKEEIVVNLKWDDVRVRLVKRNRKLPSLDRHFVSTVSCSASED